MSDQIAELWAEYSKARLAHEVAQEVEVRCSRAKAAAEEALIERMLDLDQERAEIGGRHFFLRRQISISVTKDTEDDVRGWLAATLGQDAAQDFLEVKVKKHAVARLIKDELAAKKKDIQDYPEFLKLYDRPRISVLGWDNDDAPTTTKRKDD